MNDKYILRPDGIAIPEPDLIAWAIWFEDSNRVVRQDVVGTVLISTVFLGLDHNFTGQGPPLLFETMVFRKDGDDDQ